MYQKEPLIYRYELACCYCMKLEFAKAAEIFVKLIDAENFQVRAICAIQLASCYAVLGETSKKEAILKNMVVCLTTTLI